MYTSQRLVATDSRLYYRTYRRGRLFYWSGRALLRPHNLRAANSGLRHRTHREKGLDGELPGPATDGSHGTDGAYWGVSLVPKG